MHSTRTWGHREDKKQIKLTFNLFQDSFSSQDIFQFGDVTRKECEWVVVP